MTLCWCLMEPRPSGVAVQLARQWGAKVRGRDCVRAYTALHYQAQVCAGDTMLVLDGASSFGSCCAAGKAVGS